MVACLDDLPHPQHEDAIGVDDSRKTMSDHDARLAPRAAAPRKRVELPKDLAGSKAKQGLASASGQAGELVICKSTRVQQQENAFEPLGHGVNS